MERGLGQELLAEEHPRIETHLAKALLESGRAGEALTRLQRAIECQPPFAAAFQELGIQLCALRRFDEAETVLKRGLAAVPTSVELSLDFATREGQDAFRGAGNWDLVMQAIDRCVALGLRVILPGAA